MAVSWHAGRVDKKSEFIITGRRVPTHCWRRVRPLGVDTIPLPVESTYIQLHKSIVSVDVHSSKRSQPWFSSLMYSASRAAYRAITRRIFPLHTTRAYAKVMAGQPDPINVLPRSLLDTDLYKAREHE